MDINDTVNEIVKQIISEGDTPLKRTFEQVNHVSYTKSKRSIELKIKFNQNPDGVESFYICIDMAPAPVADPPITQEEL